MKRYLAILLSLLLLMATTPVVSADGIFNDSELNWGEAPNPEPPVIPDGPYIFASQAEGKAGAEVTVTVSMMNNPGITSTKVKVHYDETALELLSFVQGDFSASGYSWGEKNSPFVINWCDMINPDNTAELLATLTFKIKDDAAGGSTYPLTLEYDNEGDIYNENWDTVWFEKVDGSVFVLYPVTGVKLDKESLDLYNGDSAALTATVLSEGKADKSVIWESDNPAVATVDENGAVTAVGLGAANITVTTVDGGYTATCAVTVACAHRETTEVEAVDSTCVVPGHEAYTLCNDCGEILAGSDAELPLADHQYVGQITTDPTCVVDGVMTYTCSVCGDSYTEAIPATGRHTYESAVTTAPTCAADGVMTYTCSVCGDSHTEAIPATGQHAHESAVTTEATCGADGVMTYTCSVCRDSYTEVIPATGAHTFDNACDATCNGCDLTRQVPDHVYDGPRDADCNECGAVREVSVAGDANGDDKVNNRDLGVLQRHLNDIPTDIDLSAADVNQDGNVNNRDLGLLQRYLNGWDVELQ